MSTSFYMKQEKKEKCETVQKELEREKERKKERKKERINKLRG